MKLRSLQPGIPNPLSLWRPRQNLIIAVRERTGRQQHNPSGPVQNNALDSGALVRSNEQRSGGRTQSANGAVPSLLAAGFRIDLSPWTLRGRRTGLNPGFFRDAA
jgi:hypothetical protein